MSITVWQRDFGGGHMQLYVTAGDFGATVTLGAQDHEDAPELPAAHDAATLEAAGFTRCEDPALVAPMMGFLDMCR